MSALDFDTEFFLAPKSRFFSQHCTIEFEVLCKVMEMETVIIS